MAGRQVYDGGPDGVTIGASASDLVSFHGAAACDQSATAAAVSTSALVAVSGAYAFATEAQATALITLANALRVCAREKGLMA